MTNFIFRIAAVKSAAAEFAAIQMTRGKNLVEIKSLFLIQVKENLQSCWESPVLVCSGTRIFLCKKARRLANERHQCPTKVRQLGHLVPENIFWATFWHFQAKTSSRYIYWYCQYLINTCNAFDISSKHPCTSYKDEKMVSLPKAEPTLKANKSSRGSNRPPISDAALPQNLFQDFWMK